MPTSGLNRKPKRSIKMILSQNRYTWLAFLIPLAILEIGYASRGIFPFGDRDILTIDLYHQYAPFLAELQNRLRSGSGLFYSWSGGLGTNFYALFAYYLASPLNLLLILFPVANITEGILAITLIKVGLAGACFYRFLRGVYHREGMAALSFAVMYALSNYVLSYSWNVMWLDGIFLLPLILLGLVRLIRDNKYLLYCLSLGLLIASNYYIAFFVCLFTVLMFPILLFRYQSFDRPWRLVGKVGQYAFFSILAGGLASILLLPTYFSLQLTSAADDVFPKTITNYFDLFDYLGQHFMLADPTIRDGMPNMYSGLLVLILLPVYFLSKRISLKEKFLHIAAILILILSFNINILNFIWHGFHFPNQLPYRNSFVYVFLILSMLYPALSSLRDFTGKQIGAICAGMMVLVLLSQKVNKEPPTWQSIYVTIIFLAIYAAVLTLDRQRKMRRSDMAMALLLVVLAEFLINTLLSLNTIDNNEHFSTRDGYSAGQEVSAIREELADISSSEGNAFYRLEMLGPKTTNDPYLYQYRGLSIFASTAPTKPVSTFENLGYHSNGINSYKYEGSTIVLDSLFGLKYLIRRGATVDERLRQLIVQRDNLHIYMNPYALSLGYQGTPLLADWHSSGKNPLEAQNQLVEALGGLPDVLVPLEQKAGTTTNMTFSSTGSEIYNYSRPNKDAASSAKITVNNNREQQVYVYLKVTANQPDNGFIMIDETKIDFSARRSTLVDLGTVAENAVIELNLNFKSTANASGTFEYYVYALDQDTFTQSIDLLSAQSLQITDFSDAHVEGTVDARQDGIFMLTIPYDAGWKVQVDGEAVDTMAIDDGFIGLTLKAGSHTIELNFIPPWFIKGLLITLGSMVLLLAICLLPRQIRRRRFLVRSGDRLSSEAVTISRQSIPAEEDSEPADPEETDDRSVAPVQTVPGSDHLPADKPEAISTADRINEQGIDDSHNQKVVQEINQDHSPIADADPMDNTSAEKHGSL